MTAVLKGTKALVTGASGFIGKHLSEKLIELGVEVHTINQNQLKTETSCGGKATSITWIM